MTLSPFVRPFLVPDHGGTGVKGGGHPADSKVPAEEEINDALGYSTPGHGKIAGTGDRGVPGSRTNPIDRAKIAAFAKQLWEEEGRPVGKADEHWSRAELELMEEESRGEEE